MSPNRSEASYSNHRTTGGRGSSTELNEEIVSTLKEVHFLLESYAPTWFTEELHKKTVAALQAIET